jgi:hypothetical protein
MRGLLFADGLGFFDQHDRDIIADFIDQLAVFAYQTILRTVQVDIALAFGACQNFQQFGFQAHFFISVEVFSLWQLQIAADKTCSQHPARTVTDARRQARWQGNRRFLGALSDE